MLALKDVPCRLAGEAPAQLDQAKLVEFLRNPAVVARGALTDAHIDQKFMMQWEAGK